jgi:hypothetical protein
VRLAHVEQMAAAIAFKVKAKGPVEISQAAWNLLRGYARAGRRDACRA